MERLPLTDDDGEVRELTGDDLRHFRPISESDPGMLAAMSAARNKGGRPKLDNPRAHIAFRWDRDLVASIKATGRGYNARVEKILRAALAKGEL